MFHDRRKLTLYLAATSVFGIMGGLFETTFHNYLADIFKVSNQARSNLEFPRELPGFLVTVVAGSLTILALNRVGAVAMLLAAAGLVGLALAPVGIGGSADPWRMWFMTASMIVFSTGIHLNMPTSSSITLALAGEGKRATLLGKVGAMAILGTVVGASVIAFAMKPLKMSFSLIYFIAAAVALAAAYLVYAMGRVERHDEPKRKVFVFKKKYARYYVLCALYGARKQVFMTFGPWVIVRMFGQPQQFIAKLWIGYSLVGLVVQPFVGRLIDKFGERRVLMTEGLALTVVCVTYAIAGHWTTSTVALSAIAAVFILDQLCFSVSMARTTYLSKIVESREDLPAALASGVSIDHLASMSLPILGGLAWAKFGFQYVFWGAAAVAVAMFVVSSRIKLETSEAGATS
jgi:MFS family permease